MHLWIAQAVSTLGSGIAAIAYPVLALTVTNSTILAGLVAFVALGGGMVFRLPAGVLIDRLPLKPILVVAESCRAVTTALLVLALLVDRLSLAQLLVSAFVTSVSGVFFETSHAVALRHVVPAGQLAPAFALNEGRGHAAGLAGQPLGGFLFQVHPTFPLLADTLSFVLSAILTASVKHPLPRSGTSAPRRRLGHDMREGIRHVLSRPFLRACLLYAMVFQFTFAGLPLAMISVMKADGVSTSHLGILFAIGAAGGLVGAAVAPGIQSHLSPRTLILGFGWASVLLLVAIGFPHGPFTTGALLGLLFLGAAPANAMLIAVQLQSTPMALQGRVLSVAMFVAGVAAPLGPPVAGALVDLTGRTWTFTALAGCVAVFTVWMHFSRPIRTLARPDAQRLPD